MKIVERMDKLRMLFATDNAVITVIEAVTLAVWLILAWKTGWTSPVMLGAVGVLFVGLAAEHTAAFRFRGNPLIPLPRGRIAGVAAVETVSWAGWLALTTVNPIGAGLFLFGTLWIGHGFERNTIRGDPFFSRPIRLETLATTIIETAIAIVWLEIVKGGGPLSAAGLVGAGVLAVGLLVEHFVSKIKG